jgi:thiamine biosynthesis lipoprotein
LDARASTVAFACPGVQLDLGAIGKGYAVERAADILRESGATSALIHGGTSSIHALGRPPEAESWQVAIELHSDSASGQLATPAPPRLRGQPRGQSRPAPPRAPVVVSLKDESLSVSAVWGRYLDAGVRRYGHVLDPRSGVPVEGAVLGAVLLPSATETDALSTALLVLGRTGGGTLGGLRPGARWLQVFDSPDGIQVTGAGIPGVALEEGH